MSLNWGTPYVIAEAGVNHNGSVETAFKLIDVAKEIGANAIKFQTFFADEIVQENAKKADYQISSTHDHETQHEMLKKLELSFDDFEKLQRHCEKKEIDFLSTPFGIKALHFLVDHLKMPMIKIGSGELTNAPYLLEAARKKIPIILSTGMSTLSEIHDALAIISYGLECSEEIKSFDEVRLFYKQDEAKKALVQNVILLHCVSNYPCLPQDANILALNTLKENFPVKIGYSDHTEGSTAAVMATALGSVLIEKHITLNKNMDGPDHKASLDPSEFASMIQQVREAYLMLGSGKKEPSTKEKEVAVAVRRSIFIDQCVQDEQIISEKEISIKRPGNGISPFLYWDVIGSKKSEIDLLLKK